MYNSTYGQTYYSATAIKICGITSQETLQVINEMLPEYVGFVFAPGKRQVTREQACILRKGLHQDIQTVGVFTDTSVEEILETAKVCRLDVIQLHIEENDETLSRLTAHFSGEIWQSYSLPALDTETEQQKEGCRISQDSLAFWSPRVAVIFDSYQGEKKGGTGKRFSWESLKDIQRQGKLILAGGLRGDNVNQAIALVKPDVVDVSSGVEADGRKDAEKIKEFIRSVRDGKIAN